MTKSNFIIADNGKVQYDFGKLIESLRRRGNSLQNLRSFLAGVEHIFLDLNELLENNVLPIKIKNIERVGIEPHFDFSQWLQVKFNFGHNSLAGWEDIITAISLGFKNFDEIEDWNNISQLASIDDHLKARDLFYQLFDEYKKEKINK